ERVGAERVIRIRRRRWHLENAVGEEQHQTLRLRVAWGHRRAEQRHDREDDDAEKADEQRDIAREPAGVGARHRALTAIARPAMPTPAPRSARAIANTSAIAEANATLPFATARMNPYPAPFQVKTYSTIASEERLVFAPSATPASSAGAALRATWRTAMGVGPRPFASAVVAWGAWRASSSGAAVGAQTY